MILLIGGAYQGKLDFARETFGFREEDIFTCAGTDIDFSKPCIDAIEEFSLARVRAGENPVDYFREHRDEWKNSVLICRDLSGGVVPMEAELRAWRQANGRLCRYLAGEADRVSRIFCGLEQRLK